MTRTRKQRRPLFLGCEGASEHAYATLLSRHASSIRFVEVHVEAVNLNPGAGDPAQLVRKATQKIADWEKKRDSFIFKSLLLDVGTAAKVAEAEALARAAGIELLIWQDPDHEALLLRHFPRCQALRPPAGQSMRALLQKFPDYEKGMTALKLSEKISLNGIVAAAGVEPTLRTLLQKIGLIGESA